MFRQAGKSPKAKAACRPMLEQARGKARDRSAPAPGLGWPNAAVSPSYSPILGKKAMDVAESRNLIHGSDCDTESRIN
jgi:hypothetical protein